MTRKEIRRLLLDARACLIDELQKRFRGRRFDLEHNRMLSDCGTYALQWHPAKKPTDAKCGYVCLVPRL